jgi:hypothetical protein
LALLLLNGVIHCATLTGLGWLMPPWIREKTGHPNWVTCYVRTPRGDFKIAARDASPTAWFAFKPPREMGRLSYWAIQFLASWKYLLLAGAALLLFNLAALLARARARFV